MFFHQTSKFGYIVALKISIEVYIWNVIKYTLFNIWWKQIRLVSVNMSFFLFDHILYIHVGDAMWRRWLWHSCVEGVRTSTHDSFLYSFWRENSGRFSFLVTTMILVTMIPLLRIGFSVYFKLLPLVYIFVSFLDEQNSCKHSQAQRIIDTDYLLNTLKCILDARV